MEHGKLTQAFLALSRPGMRAGDPDRLAARLAAYGLGGGLTSRLMRRVRVEMGHTYGIRAELPEEPVELPFLIRTFTRTDRLGQMLEAIDRVLTEVARDGLSVEEIQGARDYLHGSLPLRLTSPHAVLQYVQKGLRAGLGPDDLGNDWRAIRQVPAEAVNQAARRLIGDGQFRLVVIAPGKSALPQLEGRGAVARSRFPNAPRF